MKDGVKIFIRRKETDKFLFHLRGDKPEIPNPGCWSLLGGGIEKDETLVDAAKRELKEEIGVETEEFDELGVIDHVQKVGGEEFNIKIHLFFSEIDFEPGELTEGQKVEWLTLEDVLSKKLVPGLSELINQYKDLLLM